MPHHAPLITTLVAGIVLAFLLGAAANRLRLSPLVGYLLAGVVIGPFTPGYVADLELAPELAEIGVILLMFGVGLHFSLSDLMSVSKIAVPGAMGQIAVATVLGAGLGLHLGWPLVESFVFGLALSVASTVVLLRALQDRHLLESERGRIAVGWLIVEDLVMVLVLVLLPVLAELRGGGAETDIGAAAMQVAVTIIKVAGFVTLMLVVGARAIPWVLHRIAGTGSRELFTLSVLATALGIAFGSATLFGVSFALGAFFAGMVLAGSELSHRAAEDSLPLRDAFQVLFFVSVGMLFNPGVLLEMPLAVLATLLVIVVGKAAAAFLLVRAFGRSRGAALSIAASLAQIGEFSFILATLAVSLGLLSKDGQDLILAGAILSILINPIVFVTVDRLSTERARPAAAALAAEKPDAAGLKDHSVVVGFGLVGRRLTQALRAAGLPVVVIDDRQLGTQAARAAGIVAVDGNAADGGVLSEANLETAKWLFVAIPNVFEAGQVIAKARRVNPQLRVAARADSEIEASHLTALGADTVILGRVEIASAMAALARADAVHEPSGA